MIPRNGIYLLTRKQPPCPACKSLKLKLDKLGIKYIEWDAYEHKIPIKGVPMLIKNGSTILNGDTDLKTIKQKLEV